MLRSALLVPLAFAAGICSAQVTVDSSSARAVLKSVQDAGLTVEQAKTVCSMAGNQGLVRKENSYGRKATTQSCADALLAAAHGKLPDPAFRFRFEAIKPRTAELTALLDKIEANPVTFQQWIVERVKRFSPANSQVPIAGHLLVGGVSGGFAFGQPEFYLNLAYFDDFDVAKVVMAHELYHAVQGAYETKASSTDEEAGKSKDSAFARRCSTTYKLLNALYQEGTASYVGDPLLLLDAKSAKAKQMAEEMDQGVANPQNSVTLLELSVTGLNAPEPVPYDQIYALGFYVPEIEYKLGYLMARAIAAEHGDQAIASLLQQPAYAFTDAYLKLPKYGKDDDHPGLGANTVAAVKYLQAGCAGSTSGH